MARQDARRDIGPTPALALAYDAAMDGEGMAVDDRASFLAAFPSIQSAIKVYGDKQGMRIQLDIPESEMGEATKILLWREQVLRVTIGPESERPGKSSKIKF